MKKTLSIILSLIMIISACAFVCGAVGPDDILAVPDSGKNAEMSGTIDSSAFAFGYDVTVNADVSGLSVSAGFNVNSTGKSEDLLSAGFFVKADGVAEKDAFLAGREVEINGVIGRDLFAAGNTVTVNGVVGRNVYVGADTVIISGAVGGDLHIAASKIIVEKDAKIGGKMSYNDNAETDFKTEFEKVTYEGNVENTPTEEKEPSVISQVISTVLRFLGYVAVAYAILVLSGLWEKTEARFEGRTFGAYAAAFGIGCLVLLLVLPAVILLCVTVFGIKLAFAVLVALAFVMIISPLFVSFFVGKAIMRGGFKLPKNYWLELLVGIFVWCVLEMIPVINVIAIIVALPFAVGTTVMLLGKKRAAVQPAVVGEEESSETSDEN